MPVDSKARPHIDQLHGGLALTTVSEAEPMGASIELIRIVFKNSGCELDKSEVLAICKSLENKGLINISNSRHNVLGTVKSICTITPKGIEELGNTGQTQELTARTEARHGHGKAFKRIDPRHGKPKVAAFR